ncbi:MAG: protein translocase subunit SecF [Pseudomonadota bacterium]
MKDLTITIPFMRYRKIGAVFSIVLVLASLVALAVNGLNYALDFTGGTQVEMRYASPPDLDKIRQTLADSGFPNNEVASLGTEGSVVIRIQDGAGGGDADSESGATAIRVEEILKAASDSEVNLASSAFVGAQVGDELKEQGGFGMLVATVMLMIYIGVRFQYKFSVGAVLSVVHDVIITLGFLAVTQLDFDLNILASILAIIGYSLNDTVVVADRIRENFRILRGTGPEEIVDIAVSQTLIRTTITAVTTLLVLFALFFFGGQVLYGFSLILIVGVLVGTYSSIYVASSTLIFMNLSKEDMMPPTKDTSELDAIP